MPKETHAAPDLADINWLNRQDASRIVVARFSIAEISYALDCLADWQRKYLHAERLSSSYTAASRAGSSTSARRLRKCSISAGSSSSPLMPAVARGRVGGSGSGNMKTARRQGRRRVIRALGADERASCLLQ
jgi:hypothetical protein